MKHFFPIALIAMAAAGALSAEGERAGGAGYDLLRYLDLYLDGSQAISDQIDRIDSLESDLESARARRDSPLAIERITIELESERLRLDAVRNSEVVNALELFFACARAERGLSSAAESLRIAEEEFRIVENRYHAEEETERTLLTKKASLLQARKSLLNARGVLLQARNALFRPIDVEAGRIVLDIDWDEAGEDGPQIDPDAIASRDPDYHQSLRMLDLLTRELSLKSGSPAFTPQELSELEDSVDAAKSRLRSARWTIEDRAARIALDISTASIESEAAKINLDLARTDVDSLSLRFEYGEVLETDLARARLALQTAMDDLLALKEQRLRLSVEAFSLGGDAREVIRRFASGAGER